MTESVTLELPQHYPTPRPTQSLATIQTIAQAHAELEARLAGIHNDLQLTQTIGLLFVKRQEDLKNCFDQIQQLDTLQQQQQLQQAPSEAAQEVAAGRAAPPPLPEAMREQLALLDKEFQEGQNGIMGLKAIIDAQLPSTETQSQHDASSQMDGRGPSTLHATSLPPQTISKPRRHKINVNSVASVNDAAFPVQIQEELLNQVRYWTSQAEMKEKLNQEYDTKINEQERIIDALNKQRRLREESEERQKEEQWKLELQNQELRNQNTELQSQLSKTSHENSKFQKTIASVSEQVEQLKDKEEKIVAHLELVKSRHEQDMAAMRKHNAGVQREKSDLLKKVDDLNATMMAQQQKLSKKATLEVLALAQELDEREKENEIVVDAPILIQAPARIVVNDDSIPLPAGGLTTSASEPKIASLARETSFAHQQSIISELQSKLSKEVTEKEEILAAKDELVAEKEELVKLLADREETIESMRLEGSMNFESVPGSATRSLGHAGYTSREPSDMGLLGHSENMDPDVDHCVSDEGSHSVENKQSSPFPSGGLFAELAQATSFADIKPSREYVDQEVMTEPVEHWIHTVPSVLTSSQATAQLEKTSIGSDGPVGETAYPDMTDMTGDSASAVHVEHAVLVKPVVKFADDEFVAVISGKLGTATAAIKTLGPSEHHPGSVPSEQSTDDVDVVSGPVSRTFKSDLVANEERRHTCDLSQATAIPDTQSMPPVPTIASDIPLSNTALQGRDYGSAFGSTDGSITGTGCIRPVYQDCGNGTVKEQDDGEHESSNAAFIATIQLSDPQNTSSDNVAIAVGSTISDSHKSSTEEHALSADNVKQAIPPNKQGFAVESSIPPAQTQAKPLTVSTTRESVTGEASRQSQSPYSPSEVSPVAILPSTANGISGNITTVPAVTVKTGAIVVTDDSGTSYTYDHNSSQAHVSGAPSDLNTIPHYRHITDSSGASIDRSKFLDSPNGSILSMSTDYHDGRRGSVSSNYDVAPTDPTMIQVITQTMIGDYLWKYTRRPMGNAISDNRHRRYFWVHPYTKTMYWSLNNPGAEGSRENRAKSAFILAVFQVTDENPNGHHDLPQMSLLVQTTGRNLKLTAPTREKHELWYQSLAYLLSRPTTPGADMSSDHQTWSEVQTSRGPISIMTPPATVGHDVVLSLRNNEKSIRKKSSLNRLHSMFGRSHNSGTKDVHHYSNGSGVTPPLMAPPRLSGGMAASRSVLSISHTHHDNRNIKNEEIVS